MPQTLHPGGIGNQAGTNRVQPLLGLSRGGSPAAKGTAEIAELFHSVQIISVGTNSPASG